MPGTPVSYERCGSFNVSRPSNVSWTLTTRPRCEPNTRVTSDVSVLDTKFACLTRESRPRCVCPTLDFRVHEARPQAVNQPDGTAPTMTESFTFGEKSGGN